MDVRAELERAGIKVTSEAGEWLAAHCPLHDDQRPSLAVNIRTGGWICYAGCGTGRLEELIGRRPEGVDQDDLLEQLTKLPTGLELRLMDMPEYQIGTTARYMVDRGFTIETLKAWSIGWDPDEQRVVIPITVNDQVYGLVKRSVRDDDDGPKYTYSKGLKVSRLLFGVDRVDGDAAVVVEGPLDCIWLHQYGYPAVAILGSRASKTQVEMLVTRYWMVTLALDADEAGQAGTEHLARELAGRGTMTMVVKLPIGRKDIQECPEGELKVVIAGATPWILERR